MKGHRRSPLKDKPLRTPGQSLREERVRLWEDRIEPWAMLAVFFLAFAAYEWFRYLWQQPPMPWLMATVAAGVTAFAVWRYFRLRPALRQLRQGMEGELAVGQYLERLREQGYQVFHDVVAEGFNIDHVLIGPAGVLTVETKTWSKPSQGNARVQFDGERVLVNGRETERDVVVQAQAQARWLTRLLEESTGRRLPMQAVVVFPGWFVEAQPGAQRDVWVMEPKGLPAFLMNAPTRLAAADIKLAAFHLSRYLRACENKR